MTLTHPCAAVTFNFPRPIHRPSSSFVRPAWTWTRSTKKEIRDDIILRENEQQNM